MTQSLFTGASGLLAHQRKLDVVANNLANLNTTSYKAQRIQFADLLYDTFQTATGPSGNVSGGTNGKQIGQGVNISQVTKDFSQGILTNTGQAFDFAIEGDGFFVVEGVEQKYTRDGAFSVDANGFLVDPSSGDYVQRFGTVGQESDVAGETSFQVAGDSRISIPLGATVAGTATTEASFLGNLPATAEPPVTEILVSNTPLSAAGSSTFDPATTTLNSLDNNISDYQTGDVIQITGTNADNSSFSFDFSVDDTTTVAQLVGAVNSQFADATFELTDEGNFQLTADEVGVASLSLNLRDSDANPVGLTDFTDNLLVPLTEGTDGEIFESVVQVFDSRGEVHPIQVAFQKVGGNEWEATFSSPNDNIQVTDGTVANIRFNEDGTFQAINGTGVGDANIEFQIDSLTQPQQISISLDRLTHLSTDYVAQFEQDGFAPGSIVSVSASSDGVLTGIATNGRQVDFAQLAIAKFSNNTGLESAGQNYYVQTANSGLPTIGATGSGLVRGGQLENSNVDVALEFTQLIVAQRGFSANARTITVASEVLQELNSIGR